MTKTYRLPAGTYTNDAKHYTTVWRELASAVLEIMPGTSLAGFDPDLLFRKPDGASFSVDADLALAIFKAVRKTPLKSVAETCPACSGSGFEEAQIVGGQGIGAVLAGTKALRACRSCSKPVR